MLFGINLESSKFIYWHFKTSSNRLVFSFMPTLSKSCIEEKDFPNLTSGAEWRSIILRCLHSSLPPPSILCCREERIFNIDTRLLLSFPFCSLWVFTLERSKHRHVTPHHLGIFPLGTVNTDPANIIYKSHHGNIRPRDFFSQLRKQLKTTLESWWFSSRNRERKKF